MLKDLVINDVWKIPELDATIDPVESSFPIMPETIDADVAISGIDGEINLATTYGARNFELVIYSDDGLDIFEKNRFKLKVARFLHKYKNEAFRLVLMPYEKSYDVKYSGAIDSVEYPQSVKVSIPLKSVKSFGYLNTENILKGEWEKESKTVEPVGFVMTINGPATNPIVYLNDEELSIPQTIVANEKIVFNSKNLTVTKIDAQGVETNILKYYEAKNFPKIVEGVNTFTIKDGTVGNKENVIVQWYDLTF